MFYDLLAQISDAQSASNPHNSHPHTPISESSPKFAKSDKATAITDGPALSSDAKEKTDNSTDKSSSTSESTSRRRSSRIQLKESRAVAETKLKVGREEQVITKYIPIIIYPSNYLRLDAWHYCTRY